MNGMKEVKNIEGDLFDLAEIFASLSDDNYRETIERALDLIRERLAADRIHLCLSGRAGKTSVPTCFSRGDLGSRANDPSFADLRSVLGDERGMGGVCLEDSNCLPRSDRLGAFLQDGGARGLIVEPIHDHDELHGCLVIERTKKRMSCDVETTRIVRRFARILNKAIRRIRFHDRFDTKRSVDAAGLGTWQWDLETDETTFNEQWAAMLGYDLEELEPIGPTTWKRLTHPLDLKDSVAAIKSVIKGEEPTYRTEFRMKHKQGHYVWIRDIGRIIERQDGKPKTMAGVHIDIDLQKQKELYDQAIAQAVDHSPVGIVITSTDGTIEYVNSTFTEMTGYSQEEAIGNDPDLLMSDYHDDAFYQSIWRTISAGQEWKGEIYNKRKDGTYYWESASIAPVYDDQGVLKHFVSVKQDISDRKANEWEKRLYQEQLETEIATKIMEIDNSHRAAIIALAKLTESRDSDTGQHVERVQHLSKALARSMKEDPKHQERIDHDFLENIFYAAALHDLGKISIPDAILLKPGKLSEKEFKTIETHVKTGADLLQEMREYDTNNSIIEMGQRIALYHHEHWDGSGYPERLSGTDIPLEARI
ncbi:MAG: PAS domain S-box protein, partial [Acholeplasmataceae bacterium]